MQYLKCKALKRLKIILIYRIVLLENKNNPLQSICCTEDFAQETVPKSCDHVFSILLIFKRTRFLIIKIFIQLRCVMW